MQKIRIHYSKEGWIIDTPFGLSVPEMERAIRYHKKIQSERIKYMRGDKREDSQKALDFLRVNTLKQNILKNEFSEHLIIGR